MFCGDTVIVDEVVHVYLKERKTKNCVSQARELEKTAASKGVEIILPTDVVVADAFAADANTQVRTNYLTIHSIPFHHIPYEVLYISALSEEMSEFGRCRNFRLDIFFGI